MFVRDDFRHWFVLVHVIGSILSGLKLWHCCCWLFAHAICNFVFRLDLHFYIYILFCFCIWSLKNLVLKHTYIMVPFVMQLQWLSDADKEALELILKAAMIIDDIFYQQVHTFLHAVISCLDVCFWGMLVWLYICFSDVIQSLHFSVCTSLIFLESVKFFPFEVMPSCLGWQIQICLSLSNVVASSIQFRRCLVWVIENLFSIFSL